MLQAFATPPQYWIPFLEIAQIPGLALLVWGSVLALRSKARSLWWLLLLLPFLVNWIAGLTMVAVIFALKDRTENLPELPPISSGI